MPEDDTTRVAPAGYGQLAGQLYSQSFALQVSNRRRKNVANAAVAVPANGTAQVTSTIVMDLADVLAAGDALLFDLLQLYSNAPVAGLSITQMTFAITNGALKAWVLGNPTVTLVQVPSGGVSNVAQLSLGGLWTSLDIGFGLNKAPGPVAAADQPLNLDIVATYTNSTAAAINVSQSFMAFYRVVKGLQEG